MFPENHTGFPAGFSDAPVLFSLGRFFVFLIKDHGITGACLNMQKP